MQRNHRECGRITAVASECPEGGRGSRSQGGEAAGLGPGESGGGLRGLDSWPGLANGTSCAPTVDITSHLSC